MKILLDGKPVKCCSFADLKFSEVFSLYGCEGSCGGVYQKTSSGQMYNLSTTNVENYGGQPIIAHPEAELRLECHKSDRHEK